MNPAVEMPIKIVSPSSIDQFVVPVPLKLVVKNEVNPTVRGVAVSVEE
jgi:hypothetical protein